MAIKAQAPIVPVAIQGGRAAMRKGSWLIRPVLTRVHVGQAMETTGIGLEQRDELIARVRAAIEALMHSDPQRAELPATSNASVHGCKGC